MNNKMQNDRPLSIGGLRRRKGLCRFLASVAAAMFLFVSTAPAFADPTSVLGGNAILTGMHRATLDANDANAAAFSSSAASAVLDWSKFNVGAGQSMSFNGAGTTFFNLVDGAAGKSQIDGMINGSGNVWVINPAGIAFGAGSSVNVGGLFAAAAGNIENAAALRDGTAMTPAFSSFAGTVDASKGSFTADQVALMGKTVTTAGGDFSGARGLSVTASTGAMTVDEVEGGKVSVNISDFAADDAEVLLGDLKIGGSLSIMSTGKIATQREAPESSVKGRKMLAAAHVDGREDDGDIDISSYDIDILAADIDIDGKLWSKQGHVGVEALGTLNVNAEVEAADYVSLQAGGDVGINANVTSHDGNVIIGGSSVVLAEGATVKAESGESITSIYGTYGISGKGSVEAAGNLEMMTDFGDIDIEGVVKAKDADFKVDELLNDYYYFRDSGLFLENAENDFSGKVTAQAGVVMIQDANDITLGDVTAYRDYGNDPDIGDYRAVAVYAHDGTLTVDKGATVKTVGQETSIYLVAGKGEKYDADGTPIPVTGNVYVKGDVRADVRWSEINILSGTGANGGAGDIVIDGTVSAQTPEEWVRQGYAGLGIVEIASGYRNGSGKSDVIINEGGMVQTDGKAIVSAGDGWDVDPSTGGMVEHGVAGDVTINGVVQGGHHATLTTKDGLITIGENANVSITSEGEVTVVSGIKDGGRGDVEIHGNVHADVKNGKVLLASGYGKEAQGDVTITGNVTARDIAFAQGGAGEGAKGNVKIADGASFVAGSDATVGAHADLYTGSGDIVIQKGATVEAKGAYAQVNAVAGYGKESIGSIEVGGTARAVGSKGIVNLLASYGEQSKGGVSVSGHVESDLFSLLTTGEGDISVSRGGSVVANANNGKVELGSGLHNGAEGNVGIDGRVAALGKEAIVSVESGRGKGSHGNVSIAGSVSAGDQAVVYAGFGEGASGSAAVSGSVTAGGQAGILTRSGSISVNGSVWAGHDAQVIAGVNNGRGGDISFGANGRVTAGSLVNVVTAGGSVRQSGASVAINQSGYAEVVSIPSAVSAPEVNFNVNGNVGAGTRSPVAANGSIYAQVSGSASLAAANGQSFSGGSKPAHTPNVKLSVSDVTATPTASTTESAGRLVINTTPASQSLASGIDWGGASDNSSIFAGGDLSIYTAGSLNPYGLLVAGRDLTVSAASFGDLSYLRAGGKLTINNVGHPSHPQIAYFESVNGVEPNINNLPNDMVIFVDGRLAGGNLQIINKFGATEAFPVSTPELKSEQGIFGNPVFLHGDLDVANPMAVGNVDYMLQEIPRLTLASDFPLEVDKSVNTAGLNPKDVYRFGQHAQVAEEKPQAEQEEKKDDKASAEKSAEPKVAMR